VVRDSTVEKTKNRSHFGPSTDTLCKIDGFSPVRSSVDPADLATRRALEVRRDVVPIPNRKIGEPQRRIVVTAADAQHQRGCR